MVMTIIKRAFNVLMKKPFALWGISLLSGLLTTIGSILFGVIPGVALAISLLISTSMTMIYLAGYRGKEVHCADLFSCFRCWKTAKRVLCGMGWMALWVFLWALIPFVGIFIAIVKTYAYRLTPYILVTEPDVPALEAYKVSEQRTQGYKAKMFGAEILVFATIFVVSFVLGLFSSIPYLGVIFALVYFVFTVAVSVLSPLFMGLIQAAFYEEISNPTIPNPVYAAVGGGENVKYCPNCGAPMAKDSSFCPKCGTNQ